MNRKKAFSLFELSVVILIIGIIVAGVTQTSKMVKKSRLASAQVLTQNSIVNNLDNLVAWYETSLDSSFISAEAVDGTKISTWYDNNPKAVTKNNGLQATALNQPTYTANVFNGAIPSLKFSGGHFLTYDGTTLANTAYTIYVVEQRSNGNESYFLGGLTKSTNQNLTLGYRNSTTITQAHYSNDTTATIAAFSSATPRIHCFMFDTTNGKNYWLNGALTFSVPAQNAALSAYLDAAIGRYADGITYNGDIGEIIIFKTKLNNTDRRSIEIYLSKKYGIAIS